MGKRETSITDFWGRSLQDLLQLLEATPAGLTTDEAQRRLFLYGLNSLARESRFAGLLLGVIAALAVTYLLLVQAAKQWFYCRHALL